MSSSTAVKPTTHTACRSSDKTKLIAYQIGKNEKPVIRPYIPADEVDWSVPSPNYQPVNYTSPIVLANPEWADPPLPPINAKWNEIEGGIDRRSHLGTYEIVGGLPRNPVGRTGITGRALLGRWGPNHAADPIVTRWKLDELGNKIVHPKTNKPILQFVSIERSDTNEWAIPGGMCDAGEKVSNTMKREFMEEALNSLQMTDKQLEDYKWKLNEFFSGGVEVYRGYVDDPRNTDNSWMETIAYNFHDEDGNVFSNIQLSAGDDAKRVKWMDIDGTNLKLYASHKYLIFQVANRLDAHW